VAKKIMGSLERRPGRVNNECAEAQKHQQRLPPPGVGPHRFAKGTSRQFGGSDGHDLRIMTRAATQATEHRWPAYVINPLSPGDDILINTRLQAGDLCCERTQAVSNGLSWPRT